MDRRRFEGTHEGQFICGLKINVLISPNSRPQVYLAAIEGHVLRDMLRTFRALLEFCYLVRKDIITSTELAQLEDTLSISPVSHCLYEHWCRALPLPPSPTLSHPLFRANKAVWRTKRPVFIHHRIKTH